MRKDANFKLIINGVEVNAPRDWEDFSILATYENDGIQANISTNSLTLVNGAFDYLMGLFQAGKVFEGIPCSIIYQNSDVTEVQGFNGYIDLTKDFRYNLDKRQCEISISKVEGLNTLSNQLEALDYAYLESKGVYTQGDYENVFYVVEKKVQLIELMIALLTIYLMAKQLADSIKELNKTIADITSIATAAPPVSVAASVTYGIVLAIIQIVYIIALSALLLKLTQDVINTIYPPKRKTKVIKLGKLLSKVATYLGYQFQTGISDLDTLYYLPSNNNLDEPDPITGFIQLYRGTDKGIPSVQDTTYSCLDLFNAVKDVFNAKYQVVNGVLHFRNVDDPFWYSTAQYVKPDPLQIAEGINANELVSNRLISFRTDLADEWTIDNYKGTSYQVHTVLNSPAQIELRKGLEEVRLPFALVNRKDKLNGLERTIRDLLKAVDDVINFFGGNSNLAAQVDSKVGLMKISTNNWTVAKIAPLRAGYLPQNHRQLFSAKYLEINYHFGKSFVRNNYYAQERKVSGEKVPMDLINFVYLLNNGRFFDKDGVQLKAEQVVYTPAKNYAEIDYRYKSPYTTNLKEEYYEP